MKIMAIGDIDSDGYADIVTVEDNENKFSVHFYDPKEKNYNLWTWPTQVESGNPNARIVSIVIAKNMRRLQSLFVVYRESGTTGRTYIKVFQSTEKGFPFEENANAFAP